jgi:hypothetical protein
VALGGRHGQAFRQAPRDGSGEAEMVSNRARVAIQQDDRLTTGPVQMLVPRSVLVTVWSQIPEDGEGSAGTMTRLSARFCIQEGISGDGRGALGTAPRRLRTERQQVQFLPGAFLIPSGTTSPRPSRDARPDHLTLA